MKKMVAGDGLGIVKLYCENYVNSQAHDQKDYVRNKWMKWGLKTIITLSNIIGQKDEVVMICRKPA